MSFGSGTFHRASAAVPTVPDVELTSPPEDSISSLAFSPIGDFLAVGSWDNNVRVYEIGPQGQSAPKAMYSHQAPALAVCWNKEGNKIFSGGVDNAGRAFDVATGQSSQVAQHDAPIKCVKWVETPHGGLLATGSWDKTIKYWDTRAQSPVTSVQLPERCYSFDVRYPYLVAATAERQIQVFNLNNPTTPYKTVPSPLKWQTRVVACFSEVNNGFATGSLEGRLAIHYYEEKDSSSNFSFKCHRQDTSPGNKDQSLVYAINDISFHPTYGTFSTCGADGGLHFWDKDSRVRLKSFETSPGPAIASSFNHNGSIFAYAISYDWSKGHMGMTAGSPNKVMLKAVKDEDVKKRQKSR